MRVVKESHDGKERGIGFFYGEVRSRLSIRLASQEEHVRSVGCPEESISSPLDGLLVSCVDLCPSRAKRGPIGIGQLLSNIQLHAAAGLLPVVSHVPSVPSKETKPPFKCSSPAPVSGLSSVPDFLFLYVLSLI
jgi:hypothetical protein